MGRLEGKKIVILGARGGIGSACARALACEGARLLLSDRGEVPGAELAGVPFETYCAADCAVAADIEALFARAGALFGAIDGMLYCAGVESSDGFLTTTEEHWDRVLGVNLKGAFLACRCAVDLMDAEKGGNIALVASQKGLCGSTGSLAYNVSKGGMVIMARSMALELGKRRIRVNCVCPGPIDTDMLGRDMHNQPDPEAARRKVAASNPLNRLGNPEEIAHGVVFMMSDEAAFMTGSEIVIDGGNIAGVANL